MGHLNKILRFLLLVGVFAVPFVPLIVSSTMYFPFITGKNFTFRIIVEVMLGLWLILLYRDKTFRPKKSWVWVSFSVYILIQVLATVFSQNPTRSFWSNFERMEGLVSYLHTYVYFLITISVLRSSQIWYWLLNTSLAVSLITAIYGFSQLLGRSEIHQSGTRLDASLGNSAYMAVYMLFHIFLASYLFTVTKNKIVKLFYGLLAFFEVVILYYTATRGAILGFVGGIILMLILFSLTRSGQSRKISLTILAVVLAVIGIFISMRNTDFVKNNQVLSRFGSISASDGTTKSRFMIWQMSWRGFQEHPILGWGQENYPLVFQKYYNPAMHGQEPWFDRSHNIVFDNLINAGVLGLVSYLSIFITALYYLWKKRTVNHPGEKNIPIIFTGLLAAYFFQNLFVFDNITSIILFVIVLGFIHSLYGEEEFSRGDELISRNEKNKSKTNLREAFLPLVIIVSIASTVFLVYYFSWRGINVSQTLIRAISQGTGEQRLQDFKTIFNYQPVTGQVEAREQLLNTAGQIIASNEVSDDLKIQYFSLVTTEMKKQLEISPDDARLRLFYGGFLSDVGQTNEALTQLTEAKKLSPQKQIILFQLGTLLINSNSLAAGLKELELAFQEDSNYLEARRIYALALLYTGQPQKAEEVLGDKKNEAINDDRFLNYYAGTKQYQKVLEIWLERVKNDPKNKQNNISLAAAYYSLGNKQKSIEVVNDYIKLDPSFSSDGKKLIDQIQTGQIKN